MPKNGPIIIVDSSKDVQNRMCEAFDQIRLKNRVELCDSAEDALAFLANTVEKPFLILATTDLPGISGLEFQLKVQQTEHLLHKSMPFIFFTASESLETAGKAYVMHAQGYFIVPKDFIFLKLALLTITDYWQRSVHPSSALYDV